MKKTFVNCQKCGTKNFSDDLVCGVCNTQLYNSEGATQQITNSSSSKKTNYFVLAIIFLGLSFLYYNVLNKEKNDSNSDFQNSSSYNLQNLSTYTLLETELNNKRAFNVAVRIEKKISEYELKSIASKVKSDISALSEKGIVFFLLPEMKLNNGAWASVEFSDEIKVRIIGQSLIDEQKIRSSIDNIDDYFGLWVDNGRNGDLIIRIRKQSANGYFFEYISTSDPRPSELATRLIRSKKQGKIIFKDTDHPEQFFVLEDDGDLSVYDNYGFVVTYKNLKLNINQP